MKKFPVLVVEDVPDLRASYMRSLERFGFLVHGAGSLAEAKQLSDRQMYSVAVIDVNLHDSRVDLGDKGGHDVIRVIKEKAEGTLCMVLTGQRDIESAVFAERAGSDRVMLKLEIEDQTTVPKAVEDLMVTFRPKLIGPYADVIAYLCRPEGREIWEGTIISNLGLSAHKVFDILKVAFDDILPIRRPKNSVFGLSHDRERRRLSGHFWSRAKGCAVLVEIEPAGEESRVGVVTDEVFVDKVQFGYSVRVTRITQSRLSDYEESIALV